MAGPDRLQALLAQAHLTGIDFIYVTPVDQTNLFVHFLVSPSSLVDLASNPTPLTTGLGPAAIRIESRNSTRAARRSMRC